MSTPPPDPLAAFAAEVQHHFPGATVERRLYVLDTRDKRRLVARIVSELPANTRVEIKAAKRTLDQNSKMWAMLTEFAEQATWQGKQRSTNDWKDLFTAAVKVAGGIEPVQGLEGGFMLLGLHTSDLSVAEMADLITYMESKAAEWGVVLGGGEQAKAA